MVSDISSRLDLIAALACNQWPQGADKNTSDYRLWQRYGALELPDRVRLIRAISEQILIDLGQSEQRDQWLRLAETM